jgi:uncharacterized NAD(P)/FAD-binding protein YdhS
MSLLADQPDHFIRWIEAQDAVRDDPSARTPDGSVFPRRQVFGTYVSSQLQPYLENGSVHHLASTVSGVRHERDAWLIETENGTVVRADFVVIATSHPAPAAPTALTSLLIDHPRFIADSTRPKALDAIRQDDRVLVVGNGLTGADVVASLLATGHQGQITAISRRGLRSRGHASQPQEPYGEFSARPIRSARILLKRIRTAIAEAAVFDVSWHAVIDAVRAQGTAIWSNLPIVERRRLIRHLRVFWDVHRFRIAPQVEDALADGLRSGQFSSQAASIAAVSRHGEVIRVALKSRRSGKTEIRDFDAIILTTGPAHGGIVASQPWLQRLADDGLIVADPAGLGIDCDMRSRALGPEGVVTPNLFVAGPLARGTFGELMGLPQVAEHAADVAHELAICIAGVEGRLKRQPDAA